MTIGELFSELKDLVDDGFGGQKITYKGLAINSILETVDENLNTDGWELSDQIDFEENGKEIF